VENWGIGEDYRLNYRTGNKNITTKLPLGFGIRNLDFELQNSQGFFGFDGD